MEQKTLVEHISEIEDPRRAGYAYRHDLVEILVISVCAMFSEVEGFDCRLGAGQGAVAAPVPEA